MTTILDEPITLEQLDHLSPSSLEDWFKCRSMWYAKRIEGADMPRNEGYLLIGKVVHKAMETLVTERIYTIEDDAMLQARLTEHIVAAVQLEVPGLPQASKWEHYTECRKMITDWLARQDFTSFEPELLEYRLGIIVTTHDGKEVEVYCIADRVDRLPDGTMKITDYKTGQMVKTNAELRDDIQANFNALALSKTYPGQQFYPFIVDNMRQNLELGPHFSQSELDEFEAQLVNWVSAIYSATEYPETLNANCSWCPKVGSCTAAQASIKANGVITIAPTDAAVELVEVSVQVKALTERKKQLTEHLTAVMSEYDLPEIETPEGHKVQAVTRNTKKLNQELVKKFVPTAALAARGAEKWSIVEWNKVIDATDELDPDAVNRAKQMKTAIEHNPKPGVRVAMNKADTNSEAPVKAPAKPRKRKPANNTRDLEPEPEVVT